jgi:hypothetical protein
MASKVDSLPVLAREAAALRRAILCWGVSPEGAAWPICTGVGVDRACGLALAYGVVGVNLVASEAERAMVGDWYWLEMGLVGMRCVIVLEVCTVSDCREVSSSCCSC